MSKTLIVLFVVCYSPSLVFRYGISLNFFYFVNWSKNITFPPKKLKSHISLTPGDGCFIEAMILFLDKSAKIFILVV